jgi:hypothetical protein
MAKNAVVFSGRNGLDFNELRTGALRIPEVTLRIREAQAILDGLESESEGSVQRIDLMATIAADDEHFFRNIKLKSLLSAVVQVGLFDRFLKTQRRPDIMVGNSNGDSAMRVCSGEMSLRDLVVSSQALDTLRKASDKVVPLHPNLHTGLEAPLAAGAMPLLSGLSLTEYTAIGIQTRPDGSVTYSTLALSGMELRKLISSLHQDFEVSRFINIGPASTLRGSDYLALGLGEIESLDSIDLDPMLGWFWRSMRSQSVALAQ